ncbi:NmrA family NAD(P)-binding protein [Rhodococcus sp. D-1]|uniref:NmrA family NAD(P)-binding protein n=1 Tax=Rhodococcus sp. D-1 TaxID=1912238 RepID=UPI0015C3FFD8|nr:NmrA family NAD(P)-binding protein [Rhodococcus sp. D-1]
MGIVAKETDSTNPVVLVIGTTGQVGKLIVEEFDREPGSARVRYAARKPEQVDELHAAGRDAVRLDLDDPSTFARALHGVDRVYLLTGYTVAMLTQSTTLVDAAVKAGVSHIVHQGVFANWDATDAHFAWHQLIERYIEGSGLQWTHLHPNVFMEGLMSMTPSPTVQSRSTGAIVESAGSLHATSPPSRQPS